MVNKSPRALFSVIENRVCFGRRFETIINIYFKTEGAENFFKIMLENRTFLYMHQTLSKTTKNGSANKFCKALYNAD